MLPEGFLQVGDALLMTYRMSLTAPVQEATCGLKLSPTSSMQDGVSVRQKQRCRAPSAGRAPRCGSASFAPEKLPLSACIPRARRAPQRSVCDRSGRTQSDPGRMGSSVSNMRITLLLLPLKLKSSGSTRVRTQVSASCAFSDCQPS